MSSSRARALAYSKEVSDKKNKRITDQPNVFASGSKQPPSYAFQNDQRGEIDDTSEETKRLRDQEKAIANDQEKDVVDKSNFETGPSNGKAPPAPKVSTSKSDFAALLPAFAKCWTIVDTIDIPAVHHDEKSGFVPASFSLFEVLHEMDELLNGNEELRWINPHYFSLPVRVYYAVIYYVQVLRAKEQAGTLTKPEGSWLRAFFRRFRDAACPIAGPLVPIFSNIVSCLPDDDQFDYTYPMIMHNGSYYSSGRDQTRRTRVRAHHMLTPSVPLIASLLRDFCRTTNLTADKFDASGSYVPFHLSVGGNFAGVVFPPQTDQHHDAFLAQLLANPAISHPLPESKDRLKEIHGFWKRSKAKNIPNMLVTDEFDPTNPGDMTLLSENFDWFQPCVDMANVQVKFFSDSTNLSAIPTVGGISSLVRSDLTFADAADLPTEIDDWYPDHFSSAKATFFATSAELPLDHKYNAAYALTNTTIKWICDGEPIGSTESGLRAGPYWDNEKETFKLDNDVPVMTGIYTMLQVHFYESHGKA